MSTTGTGGGDPPDLRESAQLRESACAANCGAGPRADHEPPPGSVHHGGGGVVDSQTRVAEPFPPAHGTHRRGEPQPAMGERHHVDSSLGRGDRAVQLCVGLLRSIHSVVAVGTADASGGH